MLRRVRKWDRRRRGRAAIGWGLLTFVVAIVGQTIGFDSRAELYDVEYASRLELLKSQISTNPTSRLLLVVGSSRTAMGFAPEQLPVLRDAAGTDVLPFNFSHIGGGPTLNLMEVSRLLADGVRPRWVFLELMPAFLSHDSMPFVTANMAARDMRVLNNCVSWHRIYGDYAMRRLGMSSRYTGELIQAVAPILTQDPWSTAPFLLPLGGWACLSEDVTPTEREVYTTTTRNNYYGYLQRFNIAPLADGATRSLLNRLRKEGVQVALILMPEGTKMRGWYPPSTTERFHRYCAALSHDYDVPIVDAQIWLTDGDLRDEHHALKRGAATFTTRLGREVLRPYLATGDTSWAARFDSASGSTAYNTPRTPDSSSTQMPESSCSSGSLVSPLPPTPPPIGSARKAPISATSAR
jgi:Protein of unknown function (DUF1574)